MLKHRCFAWALAAIALWVGLGVASSQDFPSRPVRIVTSAIGGGADFTSRLVAQGLTASVGWPVVVDNRPATISAETVAKAPPDGYTLLLSGMSLWLAPLMQNNMPYDVIKDFAPVTLAAVAPNMLVVHPSVPAKSVKELIVLAKNRPAELNYATSGSGSSNHLAGELFKAMTGVNITRINYKGGGPALNDLIGGQVQLTFGAAGGVAPHVKSGKLRGLAVTTARPSKLFPELPTIAATVPGYEAASLTGIFAPAKTPVTIVNQLNQAIKAALNREDVIEKFRSSAGAEASSTSPEQFGSMVISEMDRMGKVIRNAGLRAE